jgi:RNA polymerase sigma-70 factor (ECF subfamily)
VAQWRGVLDELVRERRPALIGYACLFVADRRDADVRSALGLLSPRERACVALRYFDDLTVADIAARLGIGEGAVKRYLSDGTRKLRDALDVCVPPDDAVPEWITVTVTVTDSGTSHS